MSHIDRLKEWAVTLDIDPVTQTPNKLTIPDALFDKGWLRDNVVTNQHLNEIFNIVTGSILDLASSSIVLNPMQFKGGLNISAGDASLPVDPGAGNLYIITVAGSITVTRDGSIPSLQSVSVNDSIVFDGTQWWWFEDEGITAAKTIYDNSGSGLTATDVKAAIDEVDSRVNATNASVATLQADNPNNQTGTAYTLALPDKNKTVWMNNAAANVLTIDTNTAVAFSVNNTIMIMMEGAGATSITAAGGVTLNGVVAGSVDIIAQYTGATLVKRATDTWIITGNIGTVS